MKRILLAEDNTHLRELICDYLSENGFRVDGFKNGQDAWEAVQVSDYDLILLDVMMPEMDGFTLCRKIREAEEVPILFLTARVQEADQLYGYELGADDYIVKPFSLPVLLAKCRVILDRDRQKKICMEAGGIQIYREQKKVIADGNEVILQALDYELLYLLMKNQNRILSREQIIRKLWGYDYDGSERSVDTHVKNLRKALGDKGKYIRTIIKSGYIFKVIDGEK